MSSKQLNKKIIILLYIIASEKPTMVSALAAIPKEDGKVRIIHDSSRPFGYSMNDYSNPETTKFQTLGDACKLAKPSYFCVKIDYRLHIDLFQFFLTIMTSLAFNVYFNRKNSLV